MLHLVGTLWLFTKADINTILLPVSLFSFAVATSSSPSRAPRVVCWIWLHLLQFCISNQTLTSVDEDAINKPWRPIPSGRITVSSARKLRWFLLPACLWLSLHLGIPDAGAGLAVSILFHNELGLGRHWIGKNGLCGFGYAFFELGATRLAGLDKTLTIAQLAVVSSSALIVITTIHAQDFRDTEGDQELGRATFPLIYPYFSRQTMFPILLGWSLLLVSASDLRGLPALGLLALSTLTGLRFACLKTASADRRSYLLYNIWLSLAHIMLGSCNSKLPLLITNYQPMFPGSL